MLTRDFAFCSARGRGPSTKGKILLRIFLHLYKFSTLNYIHKISIISP